MDRITTALYQTLDNEQPASLDVAAASVKDRYNYINDGKRSLAHEAAEQVATEWTTARGVTLSV